ncbi:hypothetical protein HELRODRAFT_147718, partial [Helobdella robusta]|uniref:Uncharacterized protein n=1 Tax=Helobdella robusta TaxID=6412 RepID=T1EK24_HELRO
EGQGEIRVSIGKAELLMKERFSQFQSLIEDHVTGRSAKEVTSQDLQGFWDMVLFQ